MKANDIQIESNSSSEPKEHSIPKIYMLCMNPFCLKPKERCLDSKTIHKHPQECCHQLFPAEEVMGFNWKNMPNYPSDTLGAAVKTKYQKGNLRSFLSDSIVELKKKLQKSLAELQSYLSQLYPTEELDEYYSAVYSLNKVSQSLKLNHSGVYISNLINNNFLKPRYNALMVLNENYDDVKNMIDGLFVKMNQHISDVLHRHRQFQKVSSSSGNRSPHHKSTKDSYGRNHRPIQYDLVKSRFIASSYIEKQEGNIVFPKLKNLSSFLPWIYGEKSFNQGVHELKISSVRYPLVQNAGFTILEEQDSDTYPYTHFKSLFNKEGRGFKLKEGDQIETIIAKSTVMTLRLQLGNGSDPTPRGLIFDSEMRSVYECELKPNMYYRLGVYGSGWSIVPIEVT